MWLDEIFRQAEGSRIVRCAHEINRGEHPDFRENSGDLFLLGRRDEARAADTIVELCAQRLPKRMGMAPEEIQVLTPTRKGELGSVSLNRRLQAALNPPAKGKNEKIFGEVAFREGDRVMQIRNNYDIIWYRNALPGQKAESGFGIYNGDIGYILGIDEENETLTVDFDGRIAALGFEQLMQLEPRLGHDGPQVPGQRVPGRSACAGAGCAEAPHQGRALYGGDQSPGTAHSGGRRGNGSQDDRQPRSVKAVQRPETQALL